MTQAAEPSSPPGAAASAVRHCSVARTLDIVSDAWTFLILREMYLGAHGFSEIQSALGVSRTTLTDRLRGLVATDVLIRRPHAHVSGRFEYRLTERGLDLYLVMLTLLRFGNDHLLQGHAPSLTLFHRSCGHDCQPETLCSHCARPIDATRVTYRNGPGAGASIPPATPQRRRSGGPGVLERARPSSVSLTLQILSDRWTFLILRELFFGVRRFDHFRIALRIAPNILADRLNRLLVRGIISRVRYQTAPDRFECRLTAMGRKLYLPLIQMMRWGDRWVSPAPPILLRHVDCGHDFEPVVACDHCHAPIHAHDMEYRLNPASLERG